MSAGFDPYRKWLGIPPEELPPNHYRLLGLGLFESDFDAISNAADRQMAHVRTFQSGPHSALSQQLLNELSAARVCLLNPARKAEYDRTLRSSLRASPAPNPPASGAPVSNAPAPAPAQPRTLGSAARPRSSLSAGPALGEYGLDPPKTLARPSPKLRRLGQPKPAARTAQIGAAAVAAALIFFAAIFTLTRFKGEPPLESSAATEGAEDASLAEATRSNGRLEAGATSENAADEPPSLTRPGGESVVDVSAADAPSIGTVSPRVGPKESPSGGNRSTDHADALPEVRRQFADLTRKLNDFASWKVLSGQWSQREGGFLGKGDSRLEFSGELPAECLLTFQMNVLEGMRPRIFFFGDRNFHFGNEGYERTLFIHGEGQEGAVGKPRPYANGEALKVACRFAGRDVQFNVNGESVVRFRSKNTGPLKLTISGGDFYSPGQTRFRDFKLELRPLPPESMPAAASAPAAIPAGSPNEPPAPPDVRERIPDPALVRDAGRKVEARYQNDWRRAKKLADRLNIPLRMIDDSRGAESMPMRYALLREAAGRAAGMGDAAATCEAIDELQKHFRVDALADRLEAVRQSVLKLHDASQAWAAIMTALSLADLALRQDQLALADGFIDSAAVAAKKSGNLAIRQVIRQRTAAVARRKHEREKYDDAFERLKAAPDDPGANLTVGRYECFYLGRWEQGLPRLEKSSDATLAKLAGLEKAAAADPSQRAALADAWQAAAAQAGTDHDDYLLEANYWRLRSLSKPAVQPAAPPAVGAAIGLARTEPGLNAALFNGADFQQEVLRRVDPFIRKNFGFGSPDPKIGGDNFSIRWTGWLKPPLAGKYVLHATADDGFRLWLDGKKLLDRWGGAGDESKEVDLTEGLHALKIEYNEYGATAGVRLSWKLRDLSTDFTVPAAALFHDSAGIAEEIGQGP
ncbi:MAG TPA: PA14 domain-containing protein [Pirellulales bacterium]|nr:PA14 domain-containing protein [Pirellulales bacterium]